MKQPPRQPTGLPAIRRPWFVRVAGTAFALATVSMLVSYEEPVLALVALVLLVAGAYSMTLAIGAQEGER